MRVAELRRRLISRIERVVAEGDEEETALVLAYARAILVALAGNAPDDEVSLRETVVGTDTAALILGLHREYVRELARRGELPATKTNGELNIPLAGIVDRMSRELRSVASVPVPSIQWEHMKVEVELRQ